MTVRVFRCTECDHKMRLIGSRCGRCATDKLWWQEAWVVVVPGLIGAGLAGIAIVLLLAWLLV